MSAQALDNLEAFIDKEPTHRLLNQNFSEANLFGSGCSQAAFQQDSSEAALQQDPFEATLQQDPSGPKGQLYTGEFHTEAMTSHRMKHGVGVLHYEVEGTKGHFVYQGDFVMNKKHGQGVLTWPNGGQYKGEFVDDKFHGKGTMTWTDGHKYIGQYADDQKEGEGTCYFPNGSSCYGQFSQGKREGKVTYVSADGNKKVFFCKADKVCGTDEIGNDVVSSSGSLQSSSSNTTNASSNATVASQGPSRTNPQKWRVVHYGGAVVRFSDSLKSRQLGKIKQNEELLVIKVINRRLCVLNPVPGCAEGWISTSTEGGLKLAERIDDMDHSESSSKRSTRSLKEQLFTKLGF